MRKTTILTEKQQNVAKFAQKINKNVYEILLNFRIRSGAKECRSSRSRKMRKKCTYSRYRSCPYRRERAKFRRSKSKKYQITSTSYLAPSLHFLFCFRAYPFETTSTNRPSPGCNFNRRITFYMYI